MGVTPVRVFVVGAHIEIIWIYQDESRPFRGNILKFKQRCHVNAQSRSQRVLNWMVPPTPIELNFEDLFSEGMRFILNGRNYLCVAP